MFRLQYLTISRSQRTVVALLSATLLLSGVWRNAGAEPVTTTPAAQTQSSADVPAPSPLTPIERARAVLEKHCARCHQRGPAGQPAESHFDSVMEFDQLAQPLARLRPGLPDASRLYTDMLSGHVPQAVYDTAHPAPTPDEIDDVRGWIESLDQTKVTSCPGQHQVTLPDIANALARLRQPGGEALKGIRFISLAAYRNACADAAEMESRRRAVSDLVTALRTTLVDFDLPLATDDLPILAVRLGDMGWDPSQWDALAAAAQAPQFADTALADAYGTATPIIDVRALAAAAVAGGSYPRVAMLGVPAREFAADGRRDVDLAYAAADIGIPPSSLLRHLEDVKTPQDGTARALRQGTISNRSWHRLRPALSLPATSGALIYAEVPPAAGDETLEVSLWSEQTSYKTSDLIVITAQVNRDCNLTVVNVDGRGDATVLFPSDSDPDNAVKAGTKIRIPSDIEPYLLRAADHGTETFIAVCTLDRKRMLGVDQDFERQRFSILGNWRNFLKTAATRESLIGRRDTPRQRRARAKVVAAAAPVSKPPEQEARTAIYVKIE